MPKYVKFEGVASTDNLTPGKVYEVLLERRSADNERGGFEIKFDNGVQYFCLWQDCGFLKDCDWVECDADDTHEFAEHFVRATLDGDIDGLLCAFDWGASPQGADYWAKMFDSGQLTPEARAYLEGLLGEEGSGKFTITKDDVGRKVRLRDGSVDTIIKYDGSDLPVETEAAWHTVEGVSEMNKRFDIIEFIDEPKQMTTSQAIARLVELVAEHGDRVVTIVDGERFKIRSES